MLGDCVVEFGGVVGDDGFDLSELYGEFLKCVKLLF